MENKKGFIYFLMKRKSLCFISIFFITISGIYSYISLNKQEYPVIKSPVTIISAVYPGVSANDMEILVTKKIEDVVMKADGLDYSYSETFNGVSIVYAWFKMDLE